ncbi:jg26925, partial [Pararge aegeria aegeria]
EYQKGNSNLVVENAEMNNVVYMFRCRDSALTVRGKINGVVLDSCTKCAVVFDNLVSSVEFVNCQSVQMQSETETWLLFMGLIRGVTQRPMDRAMLGVSPRDQK